MFRYEEIKNGMVNIDIDKSKDKIHSNENSNGIEDNSCFQPTQEITLFNSHIPIVYDNNYEVRNFNRQLTSSTSLRQN